MAMARPDPILTKLRGICLSLPKAVEIVSFGHPGWQVRKKSFAFHEEYKGELCIVFKAEVPVQQALVKSARFFVAPYIGKHGWVSLRCSCGLDWEEIEDLVRESYRLVVPQSVTKERAGRSGSGRAIRRGR